MPGTQEALARASMPRGLPGAGAIDRRAGHENFPVALRVLPRGLRRDLQAIYGFARLTDEIGDTYPGDRLAALDWLERDLDAVASGDALHPVVRRLAPTVEAHSLDLRPFRDLIEANRRDQRQSRYQTFDDLLDYCRLSADPVGRLVLAVSGVDNPGAVPLSDQVCSGLQVVEHLQDVGEDLAAGRIYLPLDDLARHGCTEDQLREPTAGPALRRVVAQECGRARALLGAAWPLLPRLPGPARLAVAGFAAGGLAAIDSIEAAGHDVLGRPCRPHRRDLARHAIALLASRSRR